MARGGARPGAGRKPKVPRPVAPVTAAPPPIPGAGVVLGATPPAEGVVATVQTADISDPDYILYLAQTGQNLPDGRQLTTAMIAAAKERIAYHRHKLATTQTAQRAVRPVRELTDDELIAIVFEEIAARRSRDGTLGASSGEEGLSDVVRALSPGAEPQAAEAPPATD
jgi:hypothetical protein